MPSRLDISNPLRRAASVVVNAVLPPQCLSCSEPVDRPGALCARCWEGVRFLESPLCAVCGYPFDFDPGPDALCGSCSRRPPPYGRARAVFRYDDASRSLVLGFKHGDRTHGAPAFGRWLARAGRGLLADADVAVPVPLHRSRLFRRRYNQAALLVRALEQETGITAGLDWLVRRRRTPPQGGLSPAGRRRNVQGAFAVRRGREDAVVDRRVVLVDDVLTTGATVSACARTLLRAGAASVDVLTLARVVHPAGDQ